MMNKWKQGKVVSLKVAQLKIQRRETSELSAKERMHLSLFAKETIPKLNEKVLMEDFMRRFHKADLSKVRHNIEEIRRDIRREIGGFTEIVKQSYKLKDLEELLLKYKTGESSAPLTFIYAAAQEYIKRVYL
ncbi:MAG: hypothetical protein Q7S01_01230 [bacterium]|nr:hypothetical protein [bacterium]